MSHHARLRGTGAVLLICACGGSGPTETVLFRGESTDPAGDGGTADLASASLEVIGSNIRVRVQVAPGAFQPDSLLLIFDLDTDESPLTGYTTINPGHAGLGIDCFIELGKIIPSTRGARVERWQAGALTATWVGEVTLISNGYEATVPLIACGDDGRSVLRVESFRQLSDAAYSIRQDWMPDPGTAPTAVR